MNTDSCDMFPVADMDAAMDGPPGSFFLRECQTPGGEKYMRMWLKLPNGAFSGICVNGGPPNEPHWQWDGNLEKPTLSPSVHQIGGWHGYVRNGRMESC